MILQVAVRLGLTCPVYRINLLAVEIDAFVCESASASGSVTSPSRQSPSIAGFFDGVYSDRAEYRDWGFKIPRNQSVVHESMAILGKASPHTISESFVVLHSGSGLQECLSHTLIVRPI